MTDTPMGRAWRSFPTRAYGAAFTAPLEAGTVYRFVLGVDGAPQPLDAQALASQLHDPMATLLLRQGVFPMTMRALLAGLDAHRGKDGDLPVQRVFLVGDGGHFPFSEATRNVNRQLRLAVTRGRANETELMVSTGLDLDSEDQFLQVLAWDPVHEVFQYYQRQKPAWVWSGNSHHALQPESRGKGCFDSHVNGSLVMKELKAPWSHWHSQSAAIDGALAPDDPLRAEPLLNPLTGAQDLERFAVKPGIARWNAVRLRKDVGADGSVRNARWLLRQVLETTTVNLISSSQESALVRDDEVLRLPLTFFLNSDALLDRLGLEPDIELPSVPGHLYRRSLSTYAFERTDGSFRQPGDSHFAFLVPEPAFEDLDLLEKLVDRKVLSRKLAASLLMVDFPNPLNSPRRAALMKYVPEHFVPSAQASDLSMLLEKALLTAAATSPVDSPERECADWLRLSEGEWEAAMSARLKGYVDAVLARLATAEGFDGYVRLAESRRREFRKLPLHEFRFTTPHTNIPDDAPALQMREDGSVVPKEP